MKFLFDYTEQFITKEVIPLFWQVVADLSPWQPKFNPKLVHMLFVVTYRISEHELTVDNTRLYQQNFQMQLDSLTVHDVQLLPAHHVCCSSWFS